MDLKLEHGGNQARAEDILGIRQDLAKWLNKDPIINAQHLPLLDGEDRKSRGFYHELTGRLLCPIEYDWSDPEYVNTSSFYTALNAPQLSEFNNVYEATSLIATQASLSIACTKLEKVIQTLSKKDSFGMDILSR